MIRLFHAFCLYIKVVGITLLFLTSSTFARDVVVGFVDSVEPGYYSQTVKPTLAAIARKIPNGIVTGVRLSTDNTIEEIKRISPDILLGPASVYMELNLTLGGHSIATRRTQWAENPSASIGATIVVRNDNTSIENLQDLQSRSIVAGSPDSVDGWLAFLYELKTNRLRKDDFTQRTTFLTYPMPDVIMAVLSGKADAGILPTCMLERAEMSGLLAPGKLKVINSKTTAGFACKHSTALYPDIVVAALPDTPPAIVKATTLALLSIPEDTHYAWQVATNFVAVNRLYKELHLGPWKHLDDFTFENLWQMYGAYVMIVIAVFLWLLIDEMRLKRIVRKRTEALTKALIEREELEKQEAIARQRLNQIERMGAINQLCAMIAHELKQPMGSVINYITVLRIKLLNEMHHDDIVNKAVIGAEEETRRMVAIVDRVRKYVKRDIDRNSIVAFHQVVQKAFNYYERHTAKASHLILDKLPEVFVRGNALELELLVTNLIKNADQAASNTDTQIKAERPEVTVELKQETNASHLTEVKLIVSDNGPALTDEAFERLKRVSESVKEEGLGLGLAIVRNIVDEHAGQLTITRLSSNGIRVVVTFMTVEPDTKKKIHKETNEDHDEGGVTSQSISGA